MVIMGADIDALILGLTAALCVSVWLSEINTKGRVISASVLSSLLAGYGSPILADYLTARISEISGNVGALRLLSAILLGGAVPLIFPAGIHISPAIKRYIVKKMSV